MHLPQVRIHDLDGGRERSWAGKWIRNTLELRGPEILEIRLSTREYTFTTYELQHLYIRVNRREIIHLKRALKWYPRTVCLDFCPWLREKSRGKNFSSILTRTWPLRLIFRLITRRIFSSTLEIAPSSECKMSRCNHVRFRPKIPIAYRFMMQSDNVL